MKVEKQNNDFEYVAFSDIIDSGTFTTTYVDAQDSFHNETIFIKIQTELMKGRVNYELLDSGVFGVNDLSELAVILETGQTFLIPQDAKCVKVVGKFVY